jgi:hypothetical protein
MVALDRSRLDYGTVGFKLADTTEGRVEFGLGLAPALAGGIRPRCPATHIRVPSFITKALTTNHSPFFLTYTHH